MYFAAIAASAIAVAGAASAAGNPAHRYAQLRLWGEPGCTTLNLGEEGIYGDQLSQCNFLDENDVVRSVSFEGADDGCTLYIYSDLECHLTKQEVTVGTCLSGEAYYRSYELFCDV